MVRRSGVVKFYNVHKGFGFVAPDDGSQEIFVHFSNIASDCINGLMEGETVEFATEFDDRKGKTKATHVTGPSGMPVRGSGKGLTKGTIKGGCWNLGKGGRKGDFGVPNPSFGKGGPPQQLAPTYSNNVHKFAAPPCPPYRGNLLPFGGQPTGYGPPSSYSPTGYLGSPNAYPMGFPQTIY